MQLSNSVEIILYKSLSDIKAEAARSYLGLVWWVIEPILYLCTFYVLFVLILKRGGPDFVPIFLSGVVVWKWFDSGVKGGAHSISINRGLLQQVYVPKYIFPVIAVFGSTARFLPVFGIFTIFLLLAGVPVQITWLAVPVVMLAQFCLVISLAMLVGSITPFLPDLKVIIDNGMMMLFFVSGVFFNINDVHEPVKSYLLLNPMARLIDEYRNVLIRGVWPNYESLMVVFSVAIVFGVIGLILLKKFDNQYGKVRF